MTSKCFFRYKDHHLNWWLAVCELQDDEPGLWEISFYFDTDRPSRRGHHLFSVLERFEHSPEVRHVAQVFAGNWAAVSIGMAVDLQEIDETGSIVSNEKI